MPGSELIRRLRRSGLAFIELAVFPIASGLTAALIVDDATDSRRFGLWIGSAVTAVMAAIVSRIRRGG